jgi:hypothetical protein
MRASICSLDSISTKTKAQLRRHARQNTTKLYASRLARRKAAIMHCAPNGAERDRAQEFHRHDLQQNERLVAHTLLLKLHPRVHTPSFHRHSPPLPSLAT